MPHELYSGHFDAANTLPVSIVMSTIDHRDARAFHINEGPPDINKALQADLLPSNDDHVCDLYNSTSAAATQLSLPRSILAPNDSWGSRP